MREHVLVADGEDGVLPVDGHQAGVRLQDDVRMSVLFVSGMKKKSWFITSAPKNFGRAQEKDDPQKWSLAKILRKY